MSREQEQWDSMMLTVSTLADPSEARDDTLMISHTQSMLSPMDYPENSYILLNWDFEVWEVLMPIGLGSRAPSLSFDVNANSAGTSWSGSRNDNADMFITNKPSCVEEAKLSKDSVGVERILSEANPKDRWVIVMWVLLLMTLVMKGKGCYANALKQQQCREYKGLSFVTFIPDPSSLGYLPLTSCGIEGFPHFESTNDCS
ncbi:hypothetical protein EV421DRAFT_1738958 [Armillaria borealis]|uniref:Uncharacterized protein n=1 Tax=Armillaria borealis TaxID=47425 RepID=A0AA39MJT1_9AGAR|nr:hypothetical protein EV421DRAFT_1738958 [Armillaria borealis]